LTRDVETDWKHFYQFREVGLFLKKREIYPGFGFWLIDESLKESMRGLNMSHKVLYERGYVDAKKRINQMVARKVQPQRYTKEYREKPLQLLPLPEEYKLPEHMKPKRKPGPASARDKKKKTDRK
jgi:hypothetical protein